VSSSTRAEQQSSDEFKIEKKTNPKNVNINLRAKTVWEGDRE